MKYHIKTYGCQMNYSDSERIAGVLEVAGYEKVLNEDEADLVVLNVCTVRKSAVDRIAGNFKKYKKYKAKNPNFKTVITGCVLESDRERFKKLFDLVIDIKEIEKLPSQLELLLKNKDLPVFKTPQPPLSGGLLNFSTNKEGWGVSSDYFQITPKHQSKITAFAPIMTGCNNFCSYCVVPYTRGREKSRPTEEIIDEITGLVKNGFKEIILLGQNVNSYGAKFPISNFQFPIKSQISNTKYQINPKSQNSKFKIPDSDNITFPILLRLINNIPGDFWIRFLTSHPKDMTKELIKTVAECEKCAEHIHLALQSGDNEILEKMNRKYTAKHYLNLVKLTRKHIPNVAISTDIIVGFPGETEEQFQNTVKVMKEAKFDMAYLNKYSPRAGTASAKLVDDVSWKEKKNRENILNKVLKETALENNLKYVGKVVDVLIDESRIMNNESRIFYGKTRSFKNVKICPSIKYQVLSIKQGQFTEIKITKAGAWGLEGEVV